MNKGIGLMLFTIASITNGAYAQLAITRNINSIYDEQNPVLSQDGKHLFYTVAHNEQNIGGAQDTGDIWYSVWQDSVWSMPFHGGNVINNMAWNGVIGFDQNNNLYLHHHYKDGKQGISIALKNDDFWEKPQNIEIPYFLNKSKHQSGSISSDGKVLLMSIESYGTIGAEDIYVLFRNGNEFTEPKNIGSVINTRFQEMTPTIGEDNKTVYFASNGHNGKGSLDIFKTERLDNTWMNWSTPVNIEEVNSEGRELAYNYRKLPQNMQMVVSTKDSDGYGDIKFLKSMLDEPIEIEDTTTAILPKVIEPIESQIAAKLIGAIKSKADSSALPSNMSFLLIDAKTTLSVSTSVSGNYSLMTDYSGPVKVAIAAPGFINLVENVVLDSIESISKNFWLNPIVIGDIVKLEHVLFEQGKAIMLTASYDELDAVISMLNDNPNMEIELAGHTDNQGSSKLNYELSEKRVDAVIQYLIEKGISKRRVSGKGYGGSRPIANNNNPTTRQLNRRVEFKIIKE